MIRFSPNLHHLFLELPARERFAAVAAAGFAHVEWHFPYELPKAELAALCADNGLAFEYAVVPVDWSRDKGLAAQTGREEEFRRAFGTALDYAGAVGFRAIQVGAGDLPADGDRQRAVATLLANLDRAVAEIGDAPVTLMLEGICNARFPAQVLQTIADAAEIVRTLGAPKVQLVFDTYHLRMEEKGPLLPLLDRYIDLIGHVQIGNAPRRHQPGVGEIDLIAVVEAVAAKGFAHPIGLEFDPFGDTWSALGWVERFGQPAPVRPHPVRPDPAGRRAA